MFSLIAANKRCIFDKYLTTYHRQFREKLPDDVEDRLMHSKPPSDTNTRFSGRREKFRALAQSRTNKAIDAILRIGNLSNRQIYEFEESEVRKILRALRDAVAAVEARFESPRGKSGGGFKL